LKNGNKITCSFILTLIADLHLFLFVGCQARNCPRGQVHRSSKEMSCISVADCRSALCMVVDGIMYAEGEIMEKDLCHAW